MCAKMIFLLQFKCNPRLPRCLSGPGNWPGIDGNVGNHGIENFIKVTKHLTKLKETLTNYVYEKSHFKKTVRMKLSVDSRFSNVFYGKKQKPGYAGNQQKAF